MYAVGRLSSYISQGVYTVSAPFHPFGGAVDIIVVEQPDGSFKSSPWYVKFGKFQGVLKTREKIVSIGVNGVEADFHMYLDHKGEAYFLREVEDEEIDSTIFSPASSGDETDDPSQVGKTENDDSINATQGNMDSQIEFENRKIMVRTNSRRSRIFGLMFGGKSVKERSEQEEGDVAMARFSSLERAEIAADLLEVKWSTNLKSDIERRDDVSSFCSTDMPGAEPDEDSQVNNFIRSLHEATHPCNGEIGDGSMLGIAETESSHSVMVRSLTSDEQDKSTSTSGTSVAEDKFKETSETPTRNSVSDLGNATLDNSEESVFVTGVAFVQNSHVSKQEGDFFMPFDVEGESDGGVHCLVADLPNEESENYLVSCDSSEKSEVGVSSSGQGVETLYLYQGERKENEICSESLEKQKLISKVNSQTECASLVINEITNDIEVPRNEDSDTCPDKVTTFPCKESLFNEDTTGAATDCHPSSGIDLVTLGSGGAEIVELIHQETATERLNQESNLQTDLVDAFENRPEVNGFPDPSVAGSVKLKLEEPSTEYGFHAPRTSDDLVLLTQAQTQGVYNSSIPSNSDSLIQGKEDSEKAADMSSHHDASKIVDDPARSSTESFFTKRGQLSNLLLGSSEEDQFLFGDIDDSITSTLPCNYSAYPDTLEIENDLETENDPLVTMNNIEDLSASSDMAHTSPLFEESTTISSPMSIPRSRKSADEEVEWTIGSLPTFRSHTDDLEIANVLHPLSHSLDSHSEKLRQELLRKDVSSSTTCDLDTVNQLAEDDPTIEDKRIWEEFKNISTNRAVEISLCKHLLYEGMGADAALQAFDAHKIDLEKCASLGPGLMKNDDLTVRIGGRYFPWDAAASFILEMLSLGHDKIVEPEGMIAVDRVEKTSEDKEPPRANVPAGGNWTLWPFSLRRSATVPVQLAPTGAIDSDVVDSSKSFTDVAVNETLPLDKVAKRMVKSIVPTSKQLEMLNLNEGRNVITFTFSTAMLGKQQVDARIYLWKWNTRIVVSDVDGTITRSDVLGQFMPLVGKDWSHIGVTHLFSAIKENGYQLLFLSARAISQAHLTRQFLFNLKQDGKALPDGPVVISPDGLFPSLFREVIRRAPHEFKIACLQDIRALFPPECSPFYAGFGNRITDEISYRKLGIPKGKIFIINPKGEVAVNRRFDRKSYTSLHALVDGMFPATTTSAEQEDFNSWNYWRMPLPDITF